MLNHCVRWTHHLFIPYNHPSFPTLYLNGLMLNVVIIMIFSRTIRVITILGDLRLSLVGYEFLWFSVLSEDFYLPSCWTTMEFFLKGVILPPVHLFLLFDFGCIFIPCQDIRYVVFECSYAQEGKGTIAHFATVTYTSYINVIPSKMVFAFSSRYGIFYSLI